MPPRVGEQSVNTAEQAMELLKRLSLDERKKLLNQLAQQFATTDEELAICDAQGEVVGYLVPADLRLRLTTVEFRRELQKSSDNPGTVRPLREVIEELEARFSEH
ncbi:MAG: hypothetical protein KF708_09550 [Pirellulales bacterium]|nr:hypothetical protein [Pirellulales bacterium]